MKNTMTLTTQTVNWSDAYAPISIDCSQSTVEKISSHSGHDFDGEWAEFDRATSACELVSEFLEILSSEHSVGELGENVVDVDVSDFVDVGSEIRKIESTEGGLQRMQAARAWAGRALYGNVDSLKTLRLASGMSQAGLAKALGTDQAMISRWERGSANLEAATICKLADAFNVDTLVVWRIAEGMVFRGAVK